MYISVVNYYHYIITTHTITTHTINITINNVMSLNDGMIVV